MQNILHSKSKTFFAFCFCFLAGVAVASVFTMQIVPASVYALSIILVLVLIVWRKEKKVSFATVACACLLFGILRYAIAMPDDFALPGGRVTINGFVSREPDVRMDGVRYVFEVINHKSEIINDKKIYVRTGLYPRYEYGDVVRVECELRKPEPVEEFRYDMYLAKMHVFIVCDGPIIQKVGAGEGNTMVAGVLSLKKKTANRINRLWHEPYAGFMAGLLYGYRGGMGELNQAFVRSGVSHVVAISGYNIALIGKILHTFFVQALWINRKRAYWMIIFCILFFVVFVGMSASVVRAGIMGVLVLSAQQLGRAARSGNLLILAAAAMVFFNPFILLWDAGFQLSFLATIGIIYLPPLWERPLAKIPAFLGFREIVGSTAAAILMTLPLLLYQFGRVSLVAPIVNILILPLIPWIMGSGAMTLAFGFFFPLEKIFSWLALLGMRWVIGVVEWFARVPFASLDIRISWWMMVILYVLLFFWMYNRTRIERMKRISTNPF